MSGTHANVSAHPWDTCHAVSPICPVQATTLGYYPNVGINIFFAIGFGVAVVIALVLGIWKRTWSYMTFITAGCMLELAGYAARVSLHANPWNQQAFETQICAIILAPTLICISIYLTLKHVCLSLSPDLSRLPPSRYPFLFVPLDVSCLLVQAIGGALAASGGRTNAKLLAGGNHAIIAGVALQVCVLLFFGATSTDYFLRVRRWVASGAANPEAVSLWNDRMFRRFCIGVGCAYGAIQIRCLYRIAEMAGGWGNYIMQDQPSFIVLEGFMILPAALLLAIFSPGIFFPQMANRMSGRSRSEKRGERKAQKNAAAAAAEEKAPSRSGASGNEETSLQDLEHHSVPAAPAKS